MAWYHQYQFGEVLHPLYGRLEGHALPILQYEICENKILAVELQVKESLPMWFDRKYVRLYKSGIDLVKEPETYNRGFRGGLEKLLRGWNIRER